MAARPTKSPMIEKLTPILLVATIAMSFGIGVLWQKVNTLEKGSGGSANFAGGGADVGTVPSAPQQGKLTADQAKAIPEITKDDRARGSSNPEVTLIEYSDLQCPYCSQFHATGLEALKAYGNKLKWVYRHFPLDTIHPQARPAAIASECVLQAAGNDAFFKFIDDVFANQQTALTDVAATAGKYANAATVKSCIDGKKTNDIVEKQYQGGLTAGVTGTPGIYVINKKGDAWLIPGAVPLETLKVTIDEAIAAN